MCDGNAATGQIVISQPKVITAADFDPAKAFLDKIYYLT
jgi:hypothetical protein